MVVYRLPLNEVVFDFYDRLKSVSRGYASFDYQLDSYATGDLVLMNILINGEPVDALSVIVHRSEAERRGRALCERLKDLIPRQLFQIAIQAALGGRVVARETVKALRKDVLAKCYGGDVTRKTEASRKAERRQKADAPVRQGRHPAIGLHRRAPDGRQLRSPAAQAPPSHGFAAGPSLPRSQGRVFHAPTRSLPRMRGRVGVGAHLLIAPVTRCMKPSRAAGSIQRITATMSFSGSIQVRLPPAPLAK